MNMALLIDDTQLVQQFIAKKTDDAISLEFFTDPKSLLLALNMGSFDSIALSDRCFNFAALCEFVELIQEHGPYKVTVLLSNQHDSKTNRKIIKYCLSHDILYTHPGQTVSQIASNTYEQLYGGNKASTEKNNVVLFMGSTPNIGTTVVAYSTALEIAKQTTQHIAYICLNLKSSKIHRYMGIDQPVTTLDSIRAEIKTQALTTEKVKQYCITSKETANFHVLLGNMVREHAEFYTVEDIQHVLETASMAFDLCVVEVSAYWDNAATISGLLNADCKIIVSTNQLGHFQEDMERWLKAVSPAYGLEPQTFDLFITQLDKSMQSSNFPIRDIRKETSMNVVGKMRRLERINELLNQGKINDIMTLEPQLLADLSGLITMLITLYKLKRRQGMRKKSWFVPQRKLGG